MKVLVTLLGFLMIPVLVTIAHGDEPQIEQFSDAQHPGMLAWKIDYLAHHNLRAKR